MGIAQTLESKVGEAIRGVRAGATKVAERKLLARDLMPALATIDVTSSAFEKSGLLPRWATVEGAAAEPMPPPIAWRNIPPGTRSVALVCEDPDAPLPEPFVHWLVWGVPPTATEINDSLLAAGEPVRQGTNSMLRAGFTPAAPPRGHGRHHYHFQVFALDEEITLPAGSGRGALLDAMRGHVLAFGDLVGICERV